MAVFDNPAGTNLAILSIARRNGKTFVIAVILLAFIVGPLKERNTTIASAAMSRDQAAVVFELMIKMLDLSTTLQDGLHYKYTPSGKSITGLMQNVQYRALSRDAKTGHGKAYKIILLDEAGQIEAESDPFVEMLETSQSNYDDAIMFVISTQAPADNAYFSIIMDEAIRSQSPHTVCHVYAADKDCDLMDRDQWHKANPGLGKFRSIKEMAAKAEKAVNLPSAANGIMNLNFNMRVSLHSLYMSPEVWKKCLRPVNEDTWTTTPIDIGIDLSQRTDLTAAVACWRDEDTGRINLRTWAFAPSVGVEQREIRDKVPYRQWAKDGHMFLTPGESVDYEWVSTFIALHCAGCKIRSIQFDRWRMDHFTEAAKKTKLHAMVQKWEPVGQGYISFSPRVEAFEIEALAENICTGGNPVLNMAASQAIAVQDPAGNRKLDKSKSVQRIDPLVAAVMGVFPNSDGQVNKSFDVAALIG
jgi:phage terminase large subunit-like protein